MALKTNALADATSLYSKQKSSLSGLKSAAGNVSGVASGLYSTGSGLLSQYNDYYSGLVNSLPGQAEMPLADYVNAAANDSASNFDRSRGIQSRNMGRMGINPNSGRWQGLMANLSRNEAASRAGAMTNARITGQRENWTRSLGAAQVGTNLASTGINAQQSAGSMYATSGGLYGQAANQYGNAANEAGQYAGQTDMASSLEALLTPTAAASTNRGGYVNNGQFISYG
jgi:hypothetical protein